MKQTTIAEARRLGLLPAAERNRTVDDGASKLENAFWLAWKKVGIDGYEPFKQFKFHQTRKWKFDFAWPVYKLAVEIQGGTWIKGRHTSGSSREGEYEKMNAAQRLGWCVLQYGTERMKDPASVAAEVADILK